MSPDPNARGAQLAFLSFVFAGKIYLHYFSKHPLRKNTHLVEPRYFLQSPQTWCGERVWPNTCTLSSSPLCVCACSFYTLQKNIYWSCLKTRVHWFSAKNLVYKALTYFTYTYIKSPSDFYINSYTIAVSIFMKMKSANLCILWVVLSACNLQMLFALACYTCSYLELDGNFLPGPGLDPDCKVKQHWRKKIIYTCVW